MVGSESGYVLIPEVQEVMSIFIHRIHDEKWTSLNGHLGWYICFIANNGYSGIFYIFERFLKNPTVCPRSLVYLHVVSKLWKLDKTYLTFDIFLSYYGYIQLRDLIPSLCWNIRKVYTGWPRSNRKYILEITQLSQ